ncbi:hypothetical protein HDK90DRAFT_532527 [Phyllosticta capitalensis]|uniref:BRCT domain-containing protein n=2 Tax=Phyllosticta capitalensis TaxID=121624 RepID=A0ABR1YS94_9PEZI
MVATRAQRAHTKDEPAASTSALKQPARRGRKVAIEEPVPKSKAPEPKTRSAASKSKPKAPAPTTRRTRAKDAEAQISEDHDHEESEQKAPAQPASTTTTAKKAATKPATKSTTTTAPATRKRPAKDPEPERAPPPKRQTRARATSSAQMPEEKKAAPTRRATRAVRDEEKPSAAVKPLAQRIKVTSKETKKATRTEDAPQSDNEDVDVHMEEADTAPEPAETADKTAEPQESEPAVHQDDVRRSTRKTRAKTPKSTRKSKKEDAEPETSATPMPAKANRGEDVVEEAQETRPQTPKVAETQQEAPPSAIPVKTPRDKIATPATSGTEQQVNERTLSTKENAPTQTPAPAQLAQALPFAEAATPFFNPRAQAKISATPAPGRLAQALPFANVATPFFRPDQAPKTHSLQAATPAFKKSTLLSGTPRRDPIASPFKLAPKSAAKPSQSESSSANLLASPPKKGPMAASTLRMTPMKTTGTRTEFNSSLLQTPARKGLMLPPSTAPVNKHGHGSVQSKSSLLQTCPRRIALPPMTTASAEKPVAKMGSLFSATPRKVRIEGPPAETSVQDFAQNSVLGATPKRPRTPARSPTRRFATPGETPAKSLVDADAGSPTPVKPTPAGLKDVDSALRMLNDDRDASMLSPTLNPNTPTEQFMMNVIEKLDLDIEEQSQTFERLSATSSRDQSPGVEATRNVDVDEMDAEEGQQVVEEPATTHANESVEEESMSEDDGEVPQLQAMPSFVEPEVTMLQNHLEKALATVDEEVEGEAEFAPADRQDALVTLESKAAEETTAYPQEVDMAPEESLLFVEDQDVSVLGEVDSPVKVHLEVGPDEPVDEQPLEEMEEPKPVSFHIPERPSTPEPNEERATAMAKQKAKTEQRVRHKRLSLAIGLESSIKKPRKSLAFIPSMTPKKSALRSPFKKPFGSPKKSVAFAAEPVFEQAEIVDNPEESAYIPRPDFGLLSGMSFFVDVRSATGEDAGDLFVPLLEEMGAKVVYDWSETNSNVTHVLFKDGSNDTLHKVASSNGSVQAVNIGWALDCERFNQRLPESPYLIEIAALSPSHRPHTPTRALTLLSTNTTPTRCSSTAKATPHGTPFALLHLTPKAAPSPSAKSPVSPSVADIASPTTLLSPSSRRRSTAGDKENRGQSPRTPSPARKAYDSIENEPFTPGTPYFLNPARITQQTCPPKQTQRGFLDGARAGGASKSAVDENFIVTPFAKRLLLARRSLSPVKSVVGAFGQGAGAGSGAAEL